MTRSLMGQLYYGSLWGLAVGFWVQLPVWRVFVADSDSPVSYDVDILEEMSFLKSQEGGKITLDILPISTKAIAQQRAVTRGVNKGVKEDFKVAMEKQVSRCEENIDKLIMKFLCEERQTLLKALS